MDRVTRRSKSRKTLLPKASSESASPNEGTSANSLPRHPDVKNGFTFNSGKTVNESGVFSLTEIVIGMLVIGILLIAGLMIFRVTESGTIHQYQQEEALSLAKQKAEEVKSLINGAQSWDNIKVDVRFPPTQTPVVPSYNYYPPVTVTMGKSTYILSTEVRYVYNLSAAKLSYLPTPGTYQTPEIGSMVRIRTDAYYDDPKMFIPIATVEAG